MAHSSAEPRTVRLIPIQYCSVERQLRVRDIRNEESVRAVMYTDHEISLDEHMSYINKLKTDERNFIFVVCDEAGDVAVGTVGFNAIDRKHLKADWAFYLAGSERGSGLGSALEIAAIDFAFGPLELEKLNCEVIETNPSVIAFHKKFGFEQEGFRKSNIQKQGHRIGVAFLGLTKSAWAEQRPEITSRVPSAIEVVFDWTPQVSGLSSTVDRIEQVRAKNNLNWMNILRLAMQKSPDAARQIISDIRAKDMEIGELSGDIIKQL